MCLAAIHNGADAIYVGVPHFNARGRTTDFTLDELKEMIEALREEIRGLRKDVANLQIMINNQNKSTISNIPFTSDPNRTCPTPYPNVTGPYYPPNYTKITCSDDI